ncbi:glycosyltransferase [Paraburkholderia sp. A1RO-5L]|uniref:glycosyltransferase n=1 Tax=unclassified Paraburkholderia TaxID=2615204 RepID=UPI003B7BF10A
MILPVLLSMRRGNLSISGVMQSAQESLRDPMREQRLSALLMNLMQRNVQNVSHVIALPFIGTGGAELVALNFARAVREIHPENQVLVVVTDRSYVDPRVAVTEGVHVAVLGEFTDGDSNHKQKQQLLLDLLLAIKPRVFHAINSDAGWNVITDSGERLKLIIRLFASIFTFQFADDGKTKIGYAAYYLQPGLPMLTALLSDNERFVIDARDEYQLKEEGRKLRTVYNPSRVAVGQWKAAAFERIASRAVDGKRPSFLWAGRLDSQKRPELLAEIIRACPQYDFHVYGQAVVHDSKPLPDLPNLYMHGPFSSTEECLAERSYTAFLFTSKCEGMPNILLEIGTLGLPIIAPVVGGVGELIKNMTGYPLPELATQADYQEAMKAIIENPEEADARSRTLVELINDRHTWEHFVVQVKTLESYVNE